MEEPLKGAVAIVPFPFSDLSGSKRRPALIIADWGGEDVILCQITSKTKSDGMEVGLSAVDFDTGNLPIACNIRPNKIFTADKKSLLAIAGKIKQEKFLEVREAIIALLAFPDY